MLLDTWLLYLIACIGLSLSPGPNGLLALTHGALHGSRKTLFTIVGGATGFMLIIALCMFGIGALLKTSVVWLTVLKWLGGAYLVWLGIQVWRSPPITGEIDVNASRASGWQLYRQGVLASVTNPKVLLFSALFCLSLSTHSVTWWCSFRLAGTFIVIRCAVEGLLAKLANRIRHWLKRVGRGFNRTCGGIFIAIGTALPLRT